MKARARIRGYRKPCHRVCAAWRAITLLLLIVGSISRVSSQVLIVPSDDWHFSREVAADLQAQVKDLRQGQLQVEVQARDRMFASDAAALGRYELIVTLGNASAIAMIEATKALPVRPPIVSLLVTKRAYESVVPESATTGKRSSTAVYVDQPLARQLDLLHLALPMRTRVGTVLGPYSKRFAEELDALGRERSMRFNIAVIERSSDVFAAMQDVLSRSDVFFAVPDSIAINDSTAYGLLRASYSAGVPVMGFSESMVRAGALIGLYSTARQYARQGAEVVRQTLTDGTVPPPEYPRYFTVGVNASVARSLGLPMQSETALTDELLRRSDPSSRKPR